VVASVEQRGAIPAVVDLRADETARGTATAKTRLGALDGLRAVAVTAVIVYHLDPRWLPSGFLGVDVFMVASGFIVTKLLLDEHRRAGRVRIGAFLGRRFRRLVPALMLLLAAVALWTRAFESATVGASVRSQGIAAVFYVTNWKLIADGVSYGGVIGAESPLVHLWSLAVEEQFYLLWPPVLIGLLVVGRGRRWLLAVAAAAGALLSATLMALWYSPGEDPIRIYYGTDTRAQAFLLGALGAIILPRLTARTRAYVSRLGIVALVGVVAVMFTDSPDFLYRGGFGLVALGAAAAALATTGTGPVTSLLDRAPLRAVGRVSYGLYLWHWPAVVFLTPARLGFGGLALALVRLLATAGATAASWYLLEHPLSRANPRRVAAVGIPLIVVAAVLLMSLPTSSVLAYSDYRVDRAPPPVVAPPSTDDTGNGVTSPTATTAPSTALPTTALTTTLALPPTGTAMIVGDSGMFTAMPALTAALQSAGWQVVQTAYPGIGLTQPDGVRDGWRDNAKRYGVDLTIAMIGGWDAAWIRQHGADAYKSVVDDAVGAFTADGGKVLWLSILPGHNGDDRMIEEYFASLPARSPGTVEYLDIAPPLRAPDGSFPEFVDGRRLRGPDGWHLCPDGAAALTHFTLARLQLDRPGWENAGWRFDPRYDEGKCNA
jgi:peptidoglycan/LPS O-acetylase OafA/YrhL